MNEERSLDEALDQFGKWGEQVSKRIERLTPAEVVEYLKASQARFEQKTGKRLELPVRPAAHSTRT